MITVFIIFGIIIVTLIILHYKTKKKLSELEKILKKETPRLFIENGEAMIYTQDGKTKLIEFKINK